MPAAPLVYEILDKYDIHIMAITEHWLFNDSIDFLDSIHRNYVSHAVSDYTLNPYSPHRRGKGGVGFIYKRSLMEEKVITPLPIEDDRIIGIKLNAQDNLNVYMFSVYMPCSKETTEYYNSYLEKLCDIIDQYSELGEIILLGDFNAEIEGVKCPSPKSLRTPLLQKFTNRYKLQSVTVNRDCIGPNFTYDPYDSGLCRSLIDHIFINSDHIDLIDQSHIIRKEETNCYNSSDHLPVVAAFNIKPLIAQGVIEKVCRPKFNWNKQPECKEDYKIALSYELTGVQMPDPQDCNVTTLTKYQQELSRCMHQTATKCVPQSKFKNFLKPQWSTELKPLHKDMLKKRRIWINSRRIKGSDSHVIYRNSHNLFRRRFHQVREEERRKLFEEIDEYGEVDCRRFWAHVHQSRNKTRTKVTEIRFGNSILRDSLAICNAYADIYENLYTPLEDQSFDEKHKQAVLEKFKQYQRQSGKNHSDILDSTIHRDELRGALKELKPGKAGGPDCITNEHILHGGETIVDHMLQLCNIMTKLECVPDQMKQGLLISIPKDPRNKHQTSDNQRGITLLNVMYKLYERIILNRFVLWCNFNNLTFPDPLQCAYQKKLSSLHVSFNVQECINYNVERGSKVYCCFLDSAKAFDNVWHIGLFVKLYEMGINGKMWRIVVNAYNGMKSAVLHDGVLSRWFDVKQSVRQGGVLSAWLYLLQINDLIVELRHSGYGAGVGEIYCGVAGQADDLVLISLTPIGLQCMMNTAYCHSRKNRSKYNATKSHISVYGESKWVNKKRQKQRKWFLGGKQVQETNSVKHVGVILNNTGSLKDCVDNACSKGRGAYMSLCGAGVRPNGLNPLTSTKLYKTIVLPRCLYGCELWSHLTAENLLQIEKMQRVCCKLSQDLATRVRSDMVSSLLGLLPIDAYVDRAKLLFLQGLCTMPGHYVSKKIFLIKLQMKKVNEQLIQRGYIHDILSILDKYNLTRYIVEYIEYGYFPMKTTWKGIVDNHIMAYQNDQYQRRTKISEDFHLFTEVMPELSPSIIWKAASDIPRSLHKFHFIILALVSSGTDDHILCEYCGSMCKRLCQHLALACPETILQRDSFWEFIINWFSIEFVHALLMSDEDKLYTLMMGAALPVDLPWTFHAIFLYRCANLIWQIKPLIAKESAIFRAKRYSGP